jgi:hypothetical protein
MKRVLLLLAVAACSAASEDVCRAPLTKDMDLLGAHLTMRVPSQVRIEQRQRSIMAAPESQQEETGAVIGSSGSEMIFVVQELFATPPGDFEGAVRKDLGNDPVKVQRAELQQPLKGFAFFPAAPQAQANLLWGAYIAHPDGTVQRIAFYGDRPQAQLPEECPSQARRMAATLRPGSRRLSLTGGRAKFGNRFGLQLPPGYVTSEQRGPDFIVYKVKKIAALGTKPATLGLYVGNFPSYHETSGKVIPVILFGKSSQWHEARTPGAMNADALVVLSDTVQGNSHLREYAHVFIRAQEAKELEELEKAAATLTMP